MHLYKLTIWSLDQYSINQAITKSLKNLSKNQIFLINLITVQIKLFFTYLKH